MQKSVFHKLLMSAIQQSASDIHLQVGYPPLLRVNGELLEVKYHALSPAETQTVVEEILSQNYQDPDLEKLRETDVSYSIEGQGRFRVNIFRQRGSFGIVLRFIPIEILSFAELNLPRILEQIASLRRGLVMVVGATGNGKSTTLASMVEYINNTRRSHIVTIEDPIEFLFKHKKSVISQREVGTDTHSFPKALRSVLRQDPDVILIGEMRDQETMEAALTLAETGHLTLATLHTKGTVDSANRLIDIFPSDKN